MEKNMGKELLFGNTKINIMGHFAMIKEMDSENINGEMVLLIKVIGKTTYLVVKVQFTCMVSFNTKVNGNKAYI